MRTNRSGFRVGKWRAALLVALALTGASYQATAAAAQQTASAAAHQTTSAAAHPTATAVAGSKRPQQHSKQPRQQHSKRLAPRLTKRSRQQHSKRLAPRLTRRPLRSSAAAPQRASAAAQQPASAIAKQTTAATAQQPASAIAKQAATSNAAGGDDLAVIPDPTQPSTQTAEVISPDSPPAQAPGIAELVAALPPFTIQHFPPDVLLDAANPEIAPDAVDVAKGCAPDVPDTPPLVPLQRDNLEKAQENVDAAKQGGACLEAIMQKEAQETGTIQVDTLSEPQDHAGTSVPVAVNPTLGTPNEEDIHAPKEVEDAAQAAQEENKPGEPGEQAEPVFTPLVPDGVGCDAHQEDVLQARASKVSVEAELLVIEYIVQQCS